MKYRAIRIMNYKGIRDMTIDLRINPALPVYTLVGLNESGKTTVLDAISFFYSDFNKKGTSPLRREKVLYSKEMNNIDEMIPKGKIVNFTGSVAFYCSMDCDSKDFDELDVLLQERGYSIDLSDLPDTASANVVYEFANAKFTIRKGEVGLQLNIHNMRGKKKVEPLNSKHPMWHIAVGWLKSKMSPIIYYPNFLFEFPDRIYLSDSMEETSEQTYYRNFIQDVLDSLGRNYSIKSQILSKLDAGDSTSIEGVEAVIHQMEEKLTQMIFKSNMNVFSGDMSSKSVVIGLPKKDIENDRYYIEIKIKDGLKRFKVSERSLGFRWFFVFLLLTQFRLRRANALPPIFIFDEPASNLHQAAQERILAALAALTENEKSMVMYTTHSHYMINPEWLENAFVVINEANRNGLDEFDPDDTDIKLQRYRAFVGASSDQTSYFKPILDRLEYKPSNLDNIPDAILVEGKNDYYSLSYLKFLYGFDDLKFFPGGGAGSLDALISLYSGWGRNFIVLLDSDEEGLKQKKRYNEKFPVILKDRLFLLSDFIDLPEKSRSFEGVFSLADRMKIQSTASEAKKFSKKQFNIGMQQALASRRLLELENPEKAQTLLKSLQEKINSLK